MTSIPVFSWLEKTLRDDCAICWLRDYLIELLTLICLVLPLGILLHIHLFALLALLFILYAGWRRAAKKNEKTRRWGSVKILFFNAVYLVGGLGLLSFWWMLAVWRPGLSALLSLACLLAALILVKYESPWRNRMWWLAGAVATLLVAGLFFADYFQARDVPAERLFAEATFDAGVRADGTLVALSAKSGRAFVRGEDRWEIVPHTYGPQRLAVDTLTNHMYIANFSAEHDRAVTRLAGMEAHHFDLPDCRGPIDIAMIPEQRRLLVACEFSGTVHMVQIDEKRVETVWRLPRLPYSLAVDEIRNLVYVTGEILSGRVTKIDLGRGKPVRSRSLGMVAWGAAVDPATGNLYVAKPIAGEILVLDLDLRCLKRIKTQSAPRDLALDSERRLLLAGHYFAGTLGVIDLNTNKMIDALRVGQSGLGRQLRGVALHPDGSWLAADTSGLWKIKPLKN